MPTKLSRWPHGVALSSLAGFISILIATAQGIGVSPDSVAYLGAARNLLDGRGLSLPYGQIADAPLTHFPPLYPFLLAGSGLFDVDPVQGARWIQALLFGLLIALVGYTLHTYAHRAAGLALLGSLFILASPTLLGLSIMAWTETLFLLLSLTALVSLARFLEQSNRSWLVFTALLVAAATLTRYAGLALGLTAVVSLLFLQRGRRAQKLYNLTIFGLLSGIPLALWLFRNVSVAGTTANREFAFHPIALFHATQALGTIGEWFMLPASTPSIIKLGLLLALMMLVVVALLSPSQQRNEPEQQQSPDGSEQRYFQQVLILFIWIYAAFLVTSISFVDANTPVDSRILSPVYVTGLLLILLSAHQLSAQHKQGAILQVAALLFAIPLLALYTFQGMRLVSSNAQNGNGFTALHWRQSALIPIVKRLPAEVPIYSNAPEGLYFLTNRQAMGLPKKSKAMTREINGHYADELEQIKQQLLSEQGVLVYFTNLGRSSTTEATELQTALDLALLLQTEDGAIYQVASTKELAHQ